MLLNSFIIFAVCAASSVTRDCDPDTLISNPECAIVSSHANADSSARTVSESINDVADAARSNDLMQMIKRKFNSYFSIVGGLSFVAGAFALIAIFLLTACCCRVSLLARCILLAICAVDAVVLFAILS